MQEVLIPASRAALFCALAALASPAAHGIVLGEIEVRSALGERLDARIAVTPAAGQVVDSKCFSLLRDGDPGIPVLTEGRLTVEQVAGSPLLRVRTSTPVSEPAVIIRVRAACAADTAEALRQYILLLDPRPGSGSAISPPAIAATLNARPGDTLEGIAAKLVRGRAARRDYLAAIRSLNPSLAALGGKEPLPEGAEVALPDLRTYASIAHTAPALPSAASELAAREPAPPRLRVERKSPPKPPAVAAGPAVSEPRAPPPPVERPASKAASRPASGPASRAASGSGFVLKLSNAEVDLSRSRQIDDRARSQLRERLLVLDNDDQVAALLAMRNSLKQLEGRVAELQLKLAQMPASLAARTEAPTAAATPAPAKAPAATAKAPPVIAAPAPVAPPAEKAKPSVAAIPAVAPPPVAKPIEPPAAAPKPAEPAATAPRPAELPAPTAKVVEPPPPAAKPSEPAPIAAAPRTKPEPAPAPAPPEVPAPSVASPAAPPKSETVAAPSPKPAVKPRRAAIDEGGLSPWLWGLVAVLFFLAILLALRLWRRKQEDASQDSGWATDTDTLEPEEAAEPTPEDDIFAEEPIEVAQEVQHEEQPDLRYEARQSMASDADLETRLPQNSGELRRRYIEERFPEIVNRSVVLDDPASVVKGARLFYEDGALPRAVELLQFSIEENPGEVKTWLALFEIFRLERLTAEFAALAQRFQEHHGKSDYWAKVQYFGREIDPGNPLYKESGINTLETIGPSEARRLAAAKANFDPIAENWLNAPMDFENEVLANELRQALMVGASLTEQDLIPNPMPALRNIEMFTVA